MRIAIPVRWQETAEAGDVVHRGDAATQSSGREWQPEGWFLAALGLRHVLAMMNHITTSDAPSREPPETVLMGQDQCRLVLAIAIPTAVC